MIGEKLHSLRSEKNLSLRELAHLSGISHSHLCDVEHGRSNLSLDKLIVLAGVLGVKASFFLNEVVANGDHKDFNVLNSTP